MIRRETLIDCSSSQVKKSIHSTSFFQSVGLRPHLHSNQFQTIPFQSEEKLQFRFQVTFASSMDQQIHHYHQQHQNLIQGPWKGTVPCHWCPAFAMVHRRQRILSLSDPDPPPFLASADRLGAVYSTATSSS